MSTHATEDSPAQLLQKSFPPALLQQPGSFVGCRPIVKASAVAVTTFRCEMELVHLPGRTQDFLVHTKQHGSHLSSLSCGEGEHPELRSQSSWQGMKHVRAALILLSLLV